MARPARRGPALTRRAGAAPRAALAGLALAARLAPAPLGALAALGTLAAAAGASRAGDPPPAAPAPAPPERPTAALVDAEVDAVLAARGLAPSPVVDDGAFLRRLWLDVVGTLPPPGEVERLAADPAPDRRARAIEALLATPAAARRQAELWTAELFEAPARDAGGQLLRGLFRDWLAGELLRDAPWDALCARLVAAEGRTDEDPATLWLLERGASGDPADVAGPALRQVLGLGLECARCHDHPFQRWTQAELHGVAASFARLRIRPEEGRVAVFRVGEAPVGEHRLALGAAPKADVAPAPVGPDPSGWRPGAAPPGVTRTSRRAAFARWATSPDNPWFARAAVNRVWARRFGRGLVEPVLDLEAAPTAAEGGAPFAPLLGRLARAFAADGFSLRRLEAALLASRAWQRSARRRDDARRDDAPDDDARAAEARDLFAAARVRPLDASALAAALLRVAGRDAPGPGEPPRLHEALRARLVAELQGALPPVGARAAPDEVTTAQGLVALAGPALAGLVRGPATTAVLAAAPDRDGRLRALWERALVRAPTPAERARAAAHLAARGDDRAAWEDLVWAVLAGSELWTNH